MLLNAHQYYVMFLLTELVAFVLASYRTKEPFDICSSVEVIVVFEGNESLENMLNLTYKLMRFYIQ